MAHVFRTFGAGRPTYVKKQMWMISFRIDPPSVSLYITCCLHTCQNLIWFRMYSNTWIWPRFRYIAVTRITHATCLSFQYKCWPWLFSSCRGRHARMSLSRRKLSTHSTRNLPWHGLLVRVPWGTKAMWHDVRIECATLEHTHETNVNFECLHIDVTLLKLVELYEETHINTHTQSRPANWLNTKTVFIGYGISYSIHHYELSRGGGRMGQHVNTT